MRRRVTCVPMGRTLHKQDGFKAKGHERTESDLQVG
jgi:hypothetical protein